MVGDHQDDIAAAKNNGIASVAVLYGYSHQDALRQSQPDYEINSFSEFLTL
jgi:phosphoglycolate phosphatase-like HAD superfamily hydrolase